MTRRYHWRCYPCALPHAPAPSLAEARALADEHDRLVHRGIPTSAFGWTIHDALRARAQARALLARMEDR